MTGTKSTLTSNEYDVVAAAKAYYAKHKRWGSHPEALCNEVGRLKNALEECRHGRDHWMKEAQKLKEPAPETSEPLTLGKLIVESARGNQKERILTEQEAVELRTHIAKALEPIRAKYRHALYEGLSSSQKARASPNDAVRWICGECSTVNSNNDLHCCVKSCKGCRPFGWPNTESENV